MKYAKAIYQWWKGLSVWIRIPLCIVLVIAFLALIVERAIRFILPATDPSPYQQMAQARAAQADRSSDALKTAMEKANERYTELKEQINNDTSTVRDFEKAVRSANNINAVDDLIAKRSGREQREHKEYRKRREYND